MFYVWCSSRNMNFVQFFLVELIGLIDGLVDAMYKLNTLYII